MADISTAFEGGFLKRLRPLLPILLTAALFAGGAYALYHLLKPVNFRDVMTQIRGTPWSIIALALLATTGGYAALIGYDWSALRYIKKKLPLPVIIMGGFLGYSFGNTIGVGPISGGAVRYRIYSALGLNGFDIARIAAFGSLAFSFGATILGFGALAYHPYALESLTPVSPEILRMISLAMLLVMIGLLAVLALRKSTITIRGFRLVSPSPGVMLGQLGFTAIDLLLAATTLYLLLPPNDLGFVTFLAVFAAGMAAGVLSHIPGGVGVFETVIIAALPASVPVEQAAAGLLLYRLIYYLVPFALALVVLSVSELKMARDNVTGAQVQALTPIFKAVSSIVPLAMAAMIFASGAFMLISALIPATSNFAEDLELLLPVGFVEGGALLSSAIGAALIVVAHAMVRRVEGAYWLAAGALGAGAVVSLFHGLDYERAAVLAMALLVLLPCRREFYRSTRLTRNALSPTWIVLVAAVVLAAFAVFFFANKSTPYSNELWWQFAVDKRAPRAMRAGLVGSLVLGLMALIFILKPPRFPLGLATITDVERAAAIIAAQENPDANFALTGDKSIMFSDSGRAFLMYRIQGRSWIALGNPIGDPDDAAQLCWEFVDAANAANGRAIFYETSQEFLPLWIEMGMALHKMGEEAVVPLQEFSLEGSDRKKLRTAHNRAGRDGLSFELLAAPVSDDQIHELKQISDAWLAEKNSSEKQFSVGRFDVEYLRRFPIAIVRHQGETVAFANVLVTDLKKVATIDLMRQLPDAPPGLMDFLFTELMLNLKDQGYEEFSLGMAPLAGLETRRGSRWTARMGALIYRHGGHFYNFEGLRRFKDKFDPEWRPRFLVAPPRANILLVAADAAALISGGLRGVVSRKPSQPMPAGATEI